MTFEKGLDTTNYGDAAAIREHGSWLKGTYLETVDESRQDAISCINDVVDWTGDAARGFKDDVTKWINEMGKLAAAAQDIDKAEDHLADALDSVRKQLASAEDLARLEGLTVGSGASKEGKVESYILPPDQPASPRSVIDGWKHKPEDWVKAHESQLNAEYNAAVAAEKDYGRKINAYHQAKAKVEQARKVERDAHADFRKALGDAIAPVLGAYSLTVMAGDLSIGTVSSAQEIRELSILRADSLRAAALEMYGSADALEKIYVGKHLSAADKALVAEWIKYRTKWHASNLDDAAKFATRAQSIDKFLSDIPPSVRKAIEANPNSFIEYVAYSEKPGKHRGVGRFEKAARLALRGGKTSTVLRGIPIVGTGFTIIGGVGEVVLLGEDPAKVATKSVAGTLGSMAGGAVATALLAGTTLGAGVVVGGVVIAGFAAGQGAELLVEAVWLDDLDDFDLHVYRDDASDQDYTRRN